MHKLSLKTKTTLMLTSLALVFGFVVATPTAYALDQKQNLCGGVELNVDPGACQGEGGQLNTVIKNIVNVLSVIVGIVAVIMIIIGGFKYITSGGDSGSITSAKHTIIYAIVGLIIVALAQIIVRFVLSKTPS